MSDKKRLLIAFAGIGDLVMQVPLFRKLAETGKLDLLNRPYGPPLFSDQSFIARTYCLKHPNRGKGKLSRALVGAHRRRLGVELATRELDEIIVVSHERRVITDWVDSWRGAGVIRRMTYPERDPDGLKIAAESLGIPAAGMERCPRLEVDKESRRRARTRLAAVGGRVIGVQAGSGPVNTWLRRPFNVKGLRPSQWADLVTDILDDDGADAVVFTGSIRESRDISPIIARVPGRHHCRLHNWAGKTSLGELRAILAELHALVSVDTGPAHIAAAVGCPLLVFFGPADPKAYLPRGTGPVEAVVGCTPCQFCMGTAQFKECRNNICLNRLGRETLLEGWNRLNGQLREEDEGKTKNAAQHF